MKSNIRTVIHTCLYALLCLIITSTTFTLGYVTRAAHAPVAGEVAAFSVFWETWALVNDHFYGDKPSDTRRAHEAIRGSLAALDDPYTIFVEPQEHDREQEELRGSFGGVGAVVERTSDGRIILTPMDDRPAAKAGVMAGDELIAVDGSPITPGMPFHDVLAAVRGKVGEIVRLTIRREGYADPLTFDVKRDQIITPSVTWKLEAPGIGYVGLSMFNERTSDELKGAIRDLREQGAEAFVIDLRNNGGGLLGAAIDVASEFLKDGVVMYERKNSGEEKPYPVKGRGMLLDVPIVFLVNGGTASASEIVAGAIQDHDRGKLVGTKTFGKASVQLLFDLNDGSSLHVTNAHWLTPSRHEIHGLGLAPDMQVELSHEDRQNDRDPQRDRAVAYLREHNGRGDVTLRSVRASPEGNNP